ncbi:hypothetical protein BD311DRAFT_467126 [Dichomitus squalens]|uniref:Uncharacterized protein n=1 Tax=Dichomitus squalens TaxID=114155 RepID=A0A4V2JZS2_9APHY|nr:hypothetical protein BD311DRAFT_467126 [Dichomitus squalens]
MATAVGSCTRMLARDHDVLRRYCIQFNFGEAATQHIFRFAYVEELCWVRIACSGFPSTASEERTVHHLALHVVYSWGTGNASP